MYPSTSKYARRGEGNFNGDAPLAALPTLASPGSAAKLAVLAERVKMKLSLWHPKDAKHDTDLEKSGVVRSERQILAS